jgi:GT2 family glycosyltransferase
MTGTSTVSIIVPTYQRCRSVQRLLHALRRQTVPCNAYEVIVSIDGSTDGTAEMIEDFAGPFDLRSIRRPNMGRAAACNAGVLAARGNLIVVLDDDMEPASQFVAAHLAAQRRGAKLAVLGAVPVTLDRHSYPVGEYIKAKFQRQHAYLLDGHEAIRYMEFYTGNMSIQRELLLQVGGFDETFTVYGHEDSELAVRLLAVGVTFMYAPDALAYQYYTKDFADLAHDNVAKGKSSVLLASLHPECVPDLKLSIYQEGTLKWRVVRAVLLWLTERVPATQRSVMWFMEWFQRRRPARLHVYYSFVLDYFYWLGVREALLDNTRAGTGMTRLPDGNQYGNP